VRLPSAPRRSTYNSQVLFFELFPAFMVVVSLLIGVWLYASNRAAPDESLQDERRSRERDARRAAAGTEPERTRNPQTRRPSMRG
jgi:hypothetical protein